jgi:hypothetical protein
MQEDGSMARGNRWLVLGVVMVFAATAAADDPGTGDAVDPPATARGAGLAQEDRIAELERTVKILADELERTRADITVPEDPELKAMYGLGPAASKVFQVDRGLSVGGYAEAFYRNTVDDQGSGIGRDRDTADALRTVLYAGYKFSENIIFNSEFEWEHGTTGSTETSGGGSVSVEFANLDFFWKDYANFRSGLLLVPVGFLNEIHEPPFFYGVSRPDVERFIIPTTWREMGTGLFGSFGENVEYETYVVNGFNAAGFSPGGLRGGRQKGNRALAEHLAWVTRLNWYVMPELMLGGSVFVGQSGQNQTLAGAGGGADVRLPDARTTLWELHAQYEKRGLWLRTLFTMAHVDDAGDLTRALQGAADGGSSILDADEAIAETMLGVYGEIAYNILPLVFPETEKRLEPFFRYEFYDTQWKMPSGFDADGSKRRHILTAGLQYYPLSNVVIKADYRNRKADDGRLADELNLGIGLAF